MFIPLMIEIFVLFPHKNNKKTKKKFLKKEKKKKIYIQAQNYIPTTVFLNKMNPAPSISDKKNI